MNPLTLEWIEKAEGDFVTSRRELRARRMPNYDASCFHAQQTAEKYLKGVLQEWGETIPRTHSLIELLALCLQRDPTFNLLRPDLLVLQGYVARFRYPGQRAEKQEAKAAFRSAAIVRDFVRLKLGLP